MSSFDGRVTLISNQGRNASVGSPKSPRYDVVAVHGLGSMGVQDATWTCNRKNDGALSSWISTFLPIHAQISQIMTFDYSGKLSDGISAHVIRALATKLMDDIQKLAMSELAPAPDIVFIAQDLGGLIVKEALSMAVNSRRDYDISAKTSLLVFFSTPHRASAFRPWESIPCWLFRVSGVEKSSDSRRIDETARMLKQVNHGFDAIKNIYKIINIFYQQTGVPEIADPLIWQALDTDWRKLGASSEINIERGVPHPEGPKFSQDDDPIFARIYGELRISKGPGETLIRCLKSLGGIANQDGYSKPVSRSGQFNNTVSGALRQLEGDEAYKCWLQGNNGTLLIAGDLGTDAPRLLSLVARSNDIISIGFRCDAGDSPSNQGPTQFFASLCYQILCLRSHLFHRVSELLNLYIRASRPHMDSSDLDHWDFYLEKEWEPSLRVLFASLLPCIQGPITCLIQNIDKLQNSKQLLKDISDVSKRGLETFKLIVTTSSASAAKEVFQATDKVIHINPPLPQDIEEIVNTKVNSLLSKRPGLSSFGGELKILCRNYTHSPDLVGLSESAISSVLGVWLTHLLHISDPFTRSSLNKSVPVKMDDLYCQVLCRIPSNHQRKSQNLLTWIFYAFRPLKYGELTVATGFESGIKTVAEIRDGMPIDLASDIKSNFGDLIHVGDNQHVHMDDRFRDYIWRQRSKGDNGWPFSLGSHRDIAARCLAYLTLLAKEKPLQLPNATDGSCILSYSIQRWANHYQAGTTGRETAGFADFVKNRNLVQQWAELYFDSQPPALTSKSRHPLVVSVDVGCEDLVKALLKDPIPSSDILTIALETAIKRQNQGLVGILKDHGGSSNYPLHIVAVSGNLGLLGPFYTEGDNLESEDPQGFTALHCACQSGHLEMVKHLVQLGASANAKSQKTGQTPLHVACQFGCLDIIAYLLQDGDGVDPNEGDNFGFTPLHVACRWQQPGSVNELLEKAKPTKAINIHRQSSDSKVTPLHLAAKHGRADIVRLLLNSTQDTEEIPELLGNGVVGGFTPLHLAAQGRHSDVVRELLHFEPQGSPIAVLREDGEGCIPIHLAVQSGCAETVKQLLGHEGLAKEQIMAQGGKSDSLPIHMAVEYGQFSILQSLCHAHEEEGVPFDVFDGLFSSPLHMAASYGQVDSMRLLLDRRATPNIFDLDNNTPLIKAVRAGIPQAVELLLAREADPNTSNDDGISPLLAATEEGYTDVVNLLVKHNADLDFTRTADNLTALGIAMKHGHTRIVEILLGKMPDINAKSNSGLSPLMLVAKMGRTEVAEFILNKGADTEISGPEGRKAIHFAAESGNLDTIRLLLRGMTEVEVNGGDLENRTPLHIALGKDSCPEVIKVFLQSGASAVAEDNDGYSPFDLAESEEITELLLHSKDPREAKTQKALGHAVSKGYVKLIRDLITDNLESVTSNQRQRPHLYHLAADNNQTEVTKLLFELGIPGFDQPDGRKRTPASYASGSGDLESLKLLAKKAPESVRVPDERGRTPLSYAAQPSHTHVVKYLLDSTLAIGDVDTADARKQTPLHYAAEAGDVEAISLLLEANASKDCQDEDGQTPLFFTAWWGEQPAVRALIEAGASDIPDNEGRRLIHASYDNPDITSMIINSSELKVNVNEPAKDGSTALHLAVSAYAETVKVLLHHGADPLKQDNDNITPLHVAAARASSSETLELLLSHAKGPLDVRDKNNHTALGRAVRPGERLAPTWVTESVVAGLLKTEQFSLEEKDDDGRSLLDVAMDDPSGGSMSAIRKYISSSTHAKALSSESLEKVLVGETESRGDASLKERIMALLRERKFSPLTRASALFEAAIDTSDTLVLGFSLDLGKSHVEKRDEHGWYLEQVVAAFDSSLLVDEVSVSRSLDVDDKHLPPSGWSVTHSSDKAEIQESDRLRVKYSPNSEGYGPRRVVARSDHPIPLLKKFYFEIVVIEGSEEILGIGFGHSNCSKERMPGWDDNTWGWHGDDGGMYHADGFWEKLDPDWKYGTGDCVGCCIDPAQGKAFFTQNGNVIDACFSKIRGRLFPIVAFGRGTEVVANFGGDLKAKPFKFPNGLTREYQVSEEI